MPPTIDAIEIRRYRLPLDPPFYASWDPRPRTHHTVTMARVLAGDYEGVGTGDLMLGFAGHEDLFLGQDPFDIERHIALLDNMQFFYGRMWPLEIAFWDLMGRIRGEPVWRLLGGESGQVPVYASTGERRPVEARVESALAIQAQGFPALKIRFHADDPEEDLALARAVREAVGLEMALLVDANQGWRMPWDSSPCWDLATARRVAQALAELDVFWLEEPLHRHDYDGLAELRGDAGVRIAGGEANREMAEFYAYLEHGSLDVYQPDVAWTTGIWQGHRLAGQVQAAGALYSPHTWGDGLVLLANLHVSAAVSRSPFIEFPYDPPGWTPERRDYILPAPVLPDEDGVVTLSEAPGLGVEVNWAALEAFRI
jgi:L-alanine-DL-glutamate epimerase-like enolase superfamily enzyme